MLMYCILRLSCIVSYFILYCCILLYCIVFYCYTVLRSQLFFFSTADAGQKLLIASNRPGTFHQHGNEDHRGHGGGHRLGPQTPQPPGADDSTRLPGRQQDDVEYEDTSAEDSHGHGQGRGRGKGGDRGHGGEDNK